MTSCCRLNIESAAVYEPCVWHVKNTRPLTRTRFVKPNWPTVIARSAAAPQPLMVSLPNHVAISLRSYTRRQTNRYGDEIANPRIEYGVAMTD